MTLFKSHKHQTLVEEIVNAATHGVGAILSVIALTVLVAYASMQHSTFKVVAASLFGGTLLLMYTASTLYHAVQHANIKRVLKILDHSAIYLLIAGSYSPFLLVSLREVGLSLPLFIVIWALAVIGVIYKFFFVHRFQKLSVAIYLLMGWLALIAIKPIHQHLSHTGLMWLVGGGLSYTVGVIFYVWKRLYFSHALWHLFVLAGSACHFFAVLHHVLLP